MAEHVNRCPNCGAAVTASKFARIATCSHCGATVHLDDGVVSVARFREAHRAWRAPAPALAHASVTVDGDSWTRLSAVATGEISDVHLVQRQRWPGERALVKLLRDAGDLPLFEQEWRALKALAASRAPGAEVFARRLPQPIRFAPRPPAGAPVMLLGWAPGFDHTFEDVRRRRPGGVDPRAAVWMSRRILETLSFVHRSGLIHGAVLPQHLLVERGEHKLLRIRERLRAALADLPRGSAAADPERAVFEDDGVIERWLAAVSPLAGLVAPDDVLADWLGGGAAVVFEGAQGLLLDEAVGFHPFCTWSDCSPRNARELLAEAAPGLALQVWAVARAHAVRHGAGPLPTESAEVRPRLDHNAVNAWQGPVRYGWLDGALLRYGLALIGEIHTLVVTHLDLVDARRRWPVGVGYVSAAGTDDRALLDDRGQLLPEASPSRERQVRMGELLRRCRVQMEELPGDEATFLSGIGSLLGRDIDAISRGPRATDLSLR